MSAGRRLDQRLTAFGAETCAIYRALILIVNNISIYADKEEGVVFWADLQSVVLPLQEITPSSYRCYIYPIQSLVIKTHILGIKMRIQWISSCQQTTQHRQV